MAGQKHKSKWKAPKDLEKSQKIEARKDLKDYTHDDKDGAQNPYSDRKNKQDMVPRKTDKLVIDDIENMVPDMDAMDRLYKDLEEAEYDTKHARKVLKKRQEDDTKEYMDKRETTDHGVTTLPLEEKLSKLSEEDRERLVREYFRRKIVQVLQEQPAPPTPPAAPEAPAAPAPATAAPEAEAPATEEEPTEELPDDKSIPELLDDLRLKLVSKTTNERELADIWVAFLTKLTRDAEPKQKKNIWKQLVFKAHREMNK